MSEVCHNVQIEPQLHPLSGETLHYRSAIQDDDARVDIRASGFWRCLHHHTFFDVRVFNCFAVSNRSSTLSTAFRKHELEKRRAYALVNFMPHPPPPGGWGNTGDLTNRGVKFPTTGAKSAVKSLLCPHPYSRGFDDTSRMTKRTFHVCD